MVKTMKNCKNCEIKAIYSIILHLPTSHYISNWKPVTRTTHLIVFLLTDAGTIGIGEGMPYRSYIIEDYVKISFLAKLIQGLPLDESLNKLRSLEYKEFEEGRTINYGAYLALESALLNALSMCSKARYEAELLGGIYRAEIPVAYTIFLNHPKTMARKLKEAVELNFKHIKFKIPCNFEELEKLLKIFHSVLKQYDGRNIVLRADANGCFSTFEKAEKALSFMEKYSVNIIEQPMPQDKLKDIARLRRKFYPAIEIMLDESLRRPSDVELFAQMEVADAVNFHPSKLGCLTITREVILKTQKLGMKANIGSALMTEIGLFHYLNLAASIPRLDYPLEELGFYNVYGYGITQNPPEIVNGSIILRNADILNVNYSMVKKFLMASLFREHLLMLAGKAYRLYQKYIKCANLMHGRGESLEAVTDRERSSSY